MNTYETKTPIGLQEIKDVLNEMVMHREAYERCGIQPNHMLIALDEGNGRTTAVQYITDVFMDNHLRRFGGLDSFLEFTTDGTMEQLKRMFAEIHAAAVYTPGTECVVAIDMTHLICHVNAAQVTYCMNQLKEIGKTATLILFVPSEVNRRTDMLVEKLHTILDRLVYISVAPYTADDLTHIAIDVIQDSGVSVEATEEFENIILHIIQRENANTAKAAAKVGKNLICYADFKGFTPVLRFEHIQSIYSNSVKLQ